MKIIRVFPRKTRATPVDSLVYVGAPDMFARLQEPDSIHVSVAFSWDIQTAERLAEQWRRIAPVSIGGPATNTPGGEFVPGLYLRHGYVITSRGCPNRCWFCAVPRREGGTVRELPIRDGWNVLDDNLLACSERHIRDVFAMLTRQKRRVEFTGGMEAARLLDWHVHLLAGLRPKPAVWFAYDTPNDRAPLEHAGRRLLAAGFTRASHRVRCYVLCGFSGDTFAAAEARMLFAMQAGFDPMAMLYRDGDRQPDIEWRKFQRHWARPAIYYAKSTARSAVF